MADLISGLLAAGYTGSRNYPLYSDEYYSGTDVSIYFGDTWVDEIVSIQYDMEEKVSPIFGYADYTYSHIAKGSRTVQGKFLINFKRAGYLSAIMERISEADITAVPNAVTRDSMTVINRTMNGSNFADYAAYYEKTMWTEKGTGDGDALYLGHNYPRLSAQSFDIVIGYGAVPGQLVDKSIGHATGYTIPQGTIQIIKSATLTGRSQIIDTSDNGIMEEYSFIAQDIL